ncbi:MAG: sulfite exporter TauE/SafE family protein [Bdellovibrionota bacterium]
MIVEILGYLASILMGLTLGLLGAGGAILTVPILVYFFHVDPKIATVNSLFIVGMTAFFGAANAKFKNKLDIKVAFLFAVPGFVGVSFTKYIFLPSLPDHIFSINNLEVTKSILIMLVFSILMLYSSLAMVLGKKAEIQSLKKDISFYLKLVLQGFFVGFVTGFIGAGGGFLIIPALVGLVGLPMSIAVGTSLAIITLNSGIAFLAALHKGFIPDWNLLISLLMISLVGFFIGSYFSQKTSEKILKKIFGIFLFVVALFILFDQIKNL